jgi:hypothetical protein
MRSPLSILKKTKSIIEHPSGHFDAEHVYIDLRHMLRGHHALKGSAMKFPLCLPGNEGIISSTLNLLEVLPAQDC